MQSLARTAATVLSEARRAAMPATRLPRLGTLGVTLHFRHFPLCLPAKENYVPIPGALFLMKANDSLSHHHS